MISTSVATFLAFVFVFHHSHARDRPVIGILQKQLTDDSTVSEILASYVKYIEAAGARVITIKLDQEESYYNQLLHDINGVLLQGGGVPLHSQSLYRQAGEKIYNIALKMNKEENTFFPLWGTCLGYEMMIRIFTTKNIRARCYAEDFNSTLKFTSVNGEMFANLSPADRTAIETQNVIYNNNRWCIKDENFTKFGLDNFYNILARSKDAFGEEYIAVIEGKEVPFYGVQFHPEKPPYEWKPSANIPHSYDAIKVSQHFANFFVNQARRNQNKLKKEKLDQYDFIYNCNPFNTGRETGDMQTYYFDVSGGCRNPSPVTY